jgi:hypothetical protein
MRVGSMNYKTQIRTGSGFIRSLDYNHTDYNNWEHLSIGCS